MPIIIAYLQAFNKKELDNMQNGVKVKYPDFDFIPIIAKEIETVNGLITPPSGLDEIKKKQYLILEIQLILCLLFMFNIKLFNWF